MPPDPVLDFACRYTAAWCSQDAGSVAAFYSPDGSLCINGAGQRVHISGYERWQIAAWPHQAVAGPTSTPPITNVN